MLNWIKLNPSVITGGVAALVNMLVAYGVALTPDQAGAIGVITAALLTIIAAATTRPVSLQLVVGGVTTIVGAIGVFGIAHLTANQITTGATVLTLALAVFFHLAHTPVAAVKAGTTADALQGVPAR